MILRKQERNDLFYGATQFYARPREWANIGCTAIIITCFISRAYEFLAATHRRVCTIVARVWYVNRYVISIGAYTLLRSHLRAPLTPMTRICMHMSSTGTETDGKSLLRARPSRSAPFVVPRADPLRTPCESPANPRERVIYRKCNRRCGAIDRGARWGLASVKIFFKLTHDRIHYKYLRKRVESVPLKK